MEGTAGPEPEPGMDRAYIHLLLDHLPVIGTVPTRLVGGPPGVGLAG